MNSATRTTAWPELRAYLLTAVAVAACIPLRQLLDPVLGDKLVFVTVFPVVLVAAWYGGFGQALMATLLGSAGIAYFVLAPRYSFAIAQPEYRVGIVVNALICIACSALFASLRRARSTAQTIAWEEQFRALFEQSGVGQTLADPTTLKLTRVNRKYCEITGYSAEELIGKPFLDLTHSDDRAMSLEGYQRLVRGEVSEVAAQKRYVCKDGRVIWVQANISVVPGGPNQPVRTAAIIQDITVSKQLDLSLRESEQRFRGIFDQAAVGVGLSALDRVLLDVNPGLCRMLGYARDEMVGHHVGRFTHPDEQAAAAEAMRPVLAGEIDSVAMERRFLHKQGHYIWTHAIASLVRDRDGQPRSVLAVVQDITDRRQAEEAIREADRRKDEFLATLAHELRNPLAPICNSLHILRMAGGDAVVHQPLIEMMERQIKHMVRLVDDLLEVSRITRGKIELRPERVELAAAIRTAVEASKPAIEAGRHQLAISLPAEPIVLSADPVRLSQVFANLLHNAAKYTDSGGQIWITAQVRMDEPARAEEAVVCVRDTGIGIGADMLPRIFDMFTQTVRARGRAQGGLGIGLTLVRRLVELHGGSVEAHSDGVGRGSEFVVRLPLAAQRRPLVDDPQQQPPRPHAVFAPRRILVVDDNRDAADSLGVLLKRLGLEVRVVYDGAAGLATLASYQPAAVLLDLGMPGMDGYEVIRQARGHPASVNVTFIAVTGWGQEEDRRRSKQAGFHYHLVKPVDLSQLEALLATIASSDTSHAANPVSFG